MQVETHGREPTHLEFFKETHGKDGGGFVANTATESFLVYVLILILPLVIFRVLCFFGLLIIFILISLKLW